ncbi:sensor histidine kinase [Streptomyces sp. BE133]|uniref:sensor histidine kinase n=1 Tax=Streptomyces sp. BE133 TaxID=3002523 RepID=UPI002E78F16A|nr:sensor histidine kinase [Streptomyces sp. BE133]MEE1809661.1 sensor histidine kinase [Streptomyces sp. BE133]
MPSPPLWGRLPSSGWTALCWFAAVLFALLLFASTTYRMPSLHPALHQSVFLGLVLQAGLAVVLALAIGWARRRPLLVFGVLLAETLVMPALDAKTWPLFLAMDCLVCYIAATHPRRTAVAAAVTELATWSGEWLAVNHRQEMVSDFLSTLLAVAASIVIPWTIGNSIRQQHLYSQALRAQAATQAVTAERLRIARELHDMVAHSIGVIAIQAGAASLVIDTQPAGARKALGAIETTSRETLAGLRRMLVSLRHAEVEEDHPAKAAAAEGLEAVDRLTETTAAAGVRVEVRWRGRRRPMPPETDLAAFRIIQESVTNTVRHSGTDRCRVFVDYGVEELAIEIVDDGRGPLRGDMTAGTGFGISGMRERVALLNGRFSAGPRPEGGFRVSARLPA